MCPFSLLKALSEAFGLHRRADGLSQEYKTQRSNVAKEILGLWREFVRSHPRLSLEPSDVVFAESIFAQSTLAVANYAELAKKYPDEVARSKLFVIGEVASLARFCRETDRSEALKFSYNICFSFQEILTALEIVLRDLSEDLQATRQLIRFTRKMLLNNATHHNSLGGGMLHLYMKYSLETKQPVFQRGTLTHTDEFQVYAVARMATLSKELSWFGRFSSREEREYQLTLLDMATDEERLAHEDPQAVMHFVANFFHGNERLGCPYLRGKNLSGFIDGVLNPFL